MTLNARIVGKFHDKTDDLSRMDESLAFRNDDHDDPSMLAPMNRTHEVCGKLQHQQLEN